MKSTFHTGLLAAKMIAGAMLAAPMAMTPAALAADWDAAANNHTIGYLIVGMHWAIYETPGAKTECPQGLNPWGPREQYKELFPDNGTKRTVVETHLAREEAGWFPDTTPDKFPFYEAQGPVGLGMNLDGKVGPNDFTSPDGEKGIDNQLYRVIGCVNNLRPPDGQTEFFANQAIGEEQWNRVLLEITNVDNLDNDDHVDVTILRGRDHIYMDATGGKIMAGGSQRVDTHWGEHFTQHMKGKIVNGVLTTDPIPMGVIPWSSLQLPTVQKFHDMRLRVKLSPDGAQGMVGGYLDWENWYWQTVKSETTHYQSYGQSSPPSIYKKFVKLADAYPDPKTGKNTAISSALETTWVQVFIVHPKTETKVVGTEPAPSQKTVTAARSEAANTSTGATPRVSGAITPQ